MSVIRILPVPVLWFDNQKLLNQILRVLVEAFVKRVIQFLNLFEDQKFGLRLEGGKAGHQLVDNATDGPKVRRPEETKNRVKTGYDEHK